MWALAFEEIVRLEVQECQGITKQFSIWFPQWAGAGGELHLWKIFRPRANRTDLASIWLLGKRYSRKMTGFRKSRVFCFYSVDQGHRG